jgi:hypothetical protein
VPNNYNYFSIYFSNKNSNILQLGTSLNNEANVFESFIKIFGIASTKSEISKKLINA